MDAQGSDSGASLMDVDVARDLSMPPKVKIKDKGKYREQEDNRLCGLCNTRHGKGICYMTEDSANLVEYREILMNHASDEPQRVKVWTLSRMVFKCFNIYFRKLLSRP